MVQLTPTISLALDISLQSTAVPFVIRSAAPFPPSVISLNAAMMDSETLWLEKTHPSQTQQCHSKLDHSFGSMAQLL